MGKLEFELGTEMENRSYVEYDDAGFWLRCECSQLLRAALDQVEASKEALSLLRIFDEAALATTSLVAALRIAGRLVDLVPLDDQGGDQRREIWRVAKLSYKSPSDEIHKYFGSSVALYFAWMNSFNSWLVAPALFGLLCSVHMHVSGLTVDDHPYLPFHSLFVVLWSVVFVRCWDRRCAEKAWQWNVYGLSVVDEVRAGFRGRLRPSPVTGMPERYAPYREKVAAHAVSALVTTFMLGVAFFAMICSLNLQGYMEEHVTPLEQAFHIAPLAGLARPGAIFDPDQTFCFGLLSYVPVLMHTLVIMALNKCYRCVAERLTENENHKLQQDHDNSLIAKRFVFEAFDCYVSLFYVGFVQQDIRKLRSELVSLYTIDSLRRLLMETLVPLVTQSISRRRLAWRSDRLKKTDEGEVSEVLEVLEKPQYEQFDDFLEVVIEFGYVTIFASAFPLASLLSIICNMVEMKSDLYKLLFVCQRPRVVRAATIGVWRHLLHVIVGMAIPANVMLFSMSEQFAAWTPWLYREATERDVLTGRISSIIDDAAGSPDLVVRKSAAHLVVLAACSLEHIVGLVALALAVCIPGEPEWVAEEMQRTAWHKVVRAKRWRRQISAANEAAEDVVLVEDEDEDPFNEGSRQRKSKLQQVVAPAARWGPSQPQRRVQHQRMRVCID